MSSDDVGMAFYDAVSHELTDAEKASLGLALEELERPKAQERVGGRPPKETEEKFPSVSTTERRHDDTTD